MRFVFIVQGEGRGHLTQALTLEERLRGEGHEVAEVLVGKSRCRRLPDFFTRQLKAPLRRFESPNFLPTPANRKNNITGSVLYNLLRLPAFVRSVFFIRRRIKASGADVVVNFYELLTGMTYLFLRPGVRQVCIGHQYLFLHKDFVFPKANPIELALLRLFTRLTAIGADQRLALSFTRMADDEDNRIRVVPPLLRKEVTRLKPRQGEYIHGYMVNSGFAEQVTAWHAQHPGTPLHFFYDKKGITGTVEVDPTLHYHTLDDREFLSHMAGCRAYASTAGFESICEAMYLGKPVLMVPAHIEQECNAFDAMRAGVGVVSSDFSLDRLLQFSSTFKPNGKFLFWANNTSLIIRCLTLPLAEKRELCPQWLQCGYAIADTLIDNAATRLSRLSMAVRSAFYKKRYRYRRIDRTA